MSLLAIFYNDYLWNLKEQRVFIGLIKLTYNQRKNLKINFYKKLK